MSGTGVSPVDHAQDARATFNLTVKDEGRRMKQILLIVAAVLMTSTADAQTATSLHGHVTDPRNANVHLQMQWSTDPAFVVGVTTRDSAVSAMSWARLAGPSGPEAT